jgi:solute carrier family 13 (sodium-dependent dicarboxylate transporter), member 2/3/5
VGLVLAPAAFAGVFWAEFPSLSIEAHRLAAILSGVVVLWITEALPMPATALLGAALCVVFRVATAADVFRPFADPIMFLFIGSFMLARAIFLHRLDRRLAFGVLSLGWVGASPGRILFAFGAVTAFMSGWISNTATTAMMFAIGMSILGFLIDRPEGAAVSRRYATGLMLMTSFAASIGGLATPVGTPPNLIGLGFIDKLLGVQIPFFRWMYLGVPIVACLFLYLFVYLHWLCAAGVGGAASGVDGTELLRRERSKLGPWTTAQRSTLAAFLTTVVLWLVPGILALACGEKSAIYLAVNASLPESVVALLGASLLFLLPGGGGRRVLTWSEAAEIDWGVVLLYGGGFALGVLSNRTGLADAIGTGLAGQLPLTNDLRLLVATTVVAAVVSELTSNTASATIVVPIAISIAKASGADPLEPALGATFGASLGFMLPVSTPCNAIVYGSGYIPLTRMVRYGLLLDVAGVAVIVTAVRWLTPLVRAAG